MSPRSSGSELWFGGAGWVEGALPSRILRISHARRPPRPRQQQWFLRHHDPANDVRNHPDAGHDRRDQPNYPNNRHVDVKIFGETKADAGDFPPLPWPREPMPRYRSPNPNTTLGTNSSIILNDSSAVIAVHGVLPL